MFCPICLSSLTKTKGYDSFECIGRHNIDHNFTCFYNKSKDDRVEDYFCELYLDSRLYYIDSIYNHKSIFFIKNTQFDFEYLDYCSILEIIKKLEKMIMFS